MSPQLSILICTINDRITNVPEMLLPFRDDVHYVVSFQYTDVMFLKYIPQELTQRADVKILPWPGSGLSANRNNALNSCDTELALIADDDVRYSNENIDMVIHTFKNHPDTDIACFQAIDMEGKPLKNYSQEPFSYDSQPYGNYFTSFEIAFRTGAYIPHFDIRFGLGAPYLSCGEEEMFLFQAHKNGARISYYPSVVCTVQNRETTGTRFMCDARVRRSKGAVLYEMHGYVGALLRILKLSLRIPGKSGRWRIFRDMLNGINYAASNPLNEGSASKEYAQEHKHVNL